jgi:hypothetical protein
VRPVRHGGAAPWKQRNFMIEVIRCLPAGCRARAAIYAGPLREPVRNAREFFNLCTVFLATWKLILHKSNYMYLFYYTDYYRNSTLSLKLVSKSR